MIRARQPGNAGYMAQQGIPNLQMIQRQRSQQQLVRQRLREQQFHTQNRTGDNPGMYGGNVPSGNPNSGMMNMAQGKLLTLS